MTARLNADILVILRTDLTQLERAAHLTVKFILLLCDANVVLGYIVYQAAQVGVHVTPVWV